MTESRLYISEFKEPSSCSSSFSMSWLKSHVTLRDGRTTACQELGPWNHMEESHPKTRSPILNYYVKKKYKSINIFELLSIFSVFVAPLLLLKPVHTPSKKQERTKHFAVQRDPNTQIKCFCMVCTNYHIFICIFKVSIVEMFIQLS